MAEGAAEAVMTLVTKLMPPTTPAALVRRAALTDRLDGAFERRVTVVVADAGFGKTTLLAEWAADVHSAWYSVTPEDEALEVMTRGLVDALRLRVPGLPADLAGVLGSSRGPDAGADTELARASAAALAEALQQHLARDLVLVVDDLHEARASPGSVGLLEALCRQAPAGLHVVLASRDDLPFAVDRLRGRGQVLEFDGSDLALRGDEVLELTELLIGARDEQTALNVAQVTGGWPAAVRLALESLREVPERDRPEAFERMREPGGSLFGYLAGEVFTREDPVIRELVRVTAVLDGFTTELCDELGIAEAATAVGRLARRGLFVEPKGRRVGWYSLSTLVRQYALASMPLTDAEGERVLRTAAAWLERQGYVEEALATLAVASAGDELVRLLVERGPALLAGGAVAVVGRAAEAVPPGLRDARVEQLAGEVSQVRGDWEGAIECYERAAGNNAHLPCGLAWRIGLIHHLRGRLGEALDAYGRADETSGDEPDRALLRAWRASALWLRGDVDGCRSDATAAFAIASAARHPQALAAAHTVLAMLAALEGDRGANDAHYLRALDYAQRAGDVLQTIRIRTNRGSRHLEEGSFAEAIVELDQALRLADLTGFASFRALALTNRAEAHHRLGRLDEAIADLESARGLYQRLESQLVSYPLQKLGDVYADRGDLALARGAFEEAVGKVESERDLQGLVPALAGLARVLAVDEPEAARGYSGRALAFEDSMGHVGALLAAAWVELVAGERDAATRFATDAAALARSRRDRAGLAESLELQGLARLDPPGATTLLEQAIALWHDIGSPVDEARAQMALALLVGDEEVAEEAAGRLQTLGARGELASIRDLVSSGHGPAVEIQTLGRFRVLRAGEPVTHTEWQSRKARDLLKILAARRGRAVPRDTLMEALWPEQDPMRLGNRLSVALSTLRSVLDPEKRYDADHLVAGDRNAVWLRLEHVALDLDDFLASAAAALQRRRAGDDDAFAALARSEALYGGDFLEEDIYEDWSLGAREEARVVYGDVLRELAAIAGDAGGVDLTARYCLRLLAKDPYDEGAHLQLVGAFEAGGRHGEARRSYRQYLGRMEEIGVEAAPFPV